MLHNDLKKLNSYPFHMPGHKRNKALGITGSEIDITEINGFDNLHAPTGCIKEIEDNLSKIYNAEKSFMLINGSTVGILAAVFSVANENDTIIIARNCHKSVYNACFLRKLKIAYIEPEFDTENGYYKSVSQAEVNHAAERYKNAKAIVITSPTYEGNISSVKADIPLIIDAAHGAHLGFGDFPEYPKGDIIVSSLHKTLPALTQTAVLNIYNKKYLSKAKLYLDIFETSSPSYVLMSSVSKCVEFLKASESVFDEYCKNLSSFYKIKLNRLKLKIGDDKSKIVVSTAKTNISGPLLADILRKEYNIEAEAASRNYIIMMTSVADSKEALDTLSSALLEIDNSLAYKQDKEFPKPIEKDNMTVIKFFESTKAVSIKNSADKICAEFIYAYPPDIPLITPGERITEEFTADLLKMLESGVNILSDSNLLPHYILTKDEE